MSRVKIYGSSKFISCICENCITPYDLVADKTTKVKDIPQERLNTCWYCRPENIGKK